MAVQSMRLAEITELLGGTVEGDPQVEVSTIAPIQEAGPGALAFISNRKYVRHLKTTRASAVLVSAEVAATGRPEGVSLVVLDDPYMGFAKLLQHWTAVPRQVTGVSERAFVDPTAELGSDVNVGPNAYIGPRARIGDRADIHPGAYVGADARIGADTSVGPNASVLHECEVGARCAIYAGAVIGSDGFGFAPDLRQGLHVKIPQVGKAVIEDDVEIGANVTIDRASMGETRVGQGTKIDNLVQVGHSASIGRGCFVVSQAGISGTTRIGNGVTIAGQAGIAGHVKVGDGAVIGAQAGVHSDVPPMARLLGSPAVEGDLAKRAMIVFRKLPDLRARVRDLEKRLAAMERAPADG